MLERKINCNGCTLCCQKDLIMLHPEHGDVPEDYETIPVGDLFALAHKPNGECIYLEKGCTIYERRPVICREFDCADLMRRTTSHDRKLMLKNGWINKEVLRAGRRRMK